jgi:hypothetical protein
MKITMGIIAAVLALGVPGQLVQAQTPDLVWAEWADDDYEIQTSTDPVGSVDEGTVVMSWNAQNGTAIASIAGSYDFFQPEIELRWDSAPGPFPLYINVDTATPYTYVLDVDWHTDAFEHDSELRSLNGDHEWGILVPGPGRVSVNVHINEPMVEHDLTMTLYWGEGTPVEASTFGAVKALFR